MTDDVDLVAICRALGDPTRMRILDLLKAKGRSCCDLVATSERGLCACDVEAAVGLSKAAVSHHMAQLRRAGLITQEKRGRWMFYARNEPAIAGLPEWIARAV